jgi:hypothetical protein
VKDYAFALKLENAPSERIEIPSPLYVKDLEPFIEKGKMKFTIIVGSPDPHGPWKSRGLDSPCAIDLALFLGSFIHGKISPNYKLDIEVREKDLKGNLILVGGPMVNMTTKKVNNRLPIRVDLKNKNIVSKISKKSYIEEECGFIDIIDNPWHKPSKILVLAGKRFPGTRASILTFIKDLEKVMEGNRFNRKVIAKVVRGYDLNGDGIIDSSEILE